MQGILRNEGEHTGAFCAATGAAITRNSLIAGLNAGTRSMAAASHDVGAWGSMTSA